MADIQDGQHRIERVHTYAQWSQAKHVTRGTWPDVTDAARQAIADQYAIDFERFGYDPEMAL